MKKDNQKSKILLTGIIALSILALTSVFLFRYSLAYFKDTKSASASFKFQSVGVAWVGEVDLYKDSSRLIATDKKLLKNKTCYFKNISVNNTGDVNMYLRFKVTAPSGVTVTFDGLTESGGYYYYVSGSNLADLTSGGTLSISGTILNTSSGTSVEITFIVEAVQKVSDTATSLANADTLWPSTSTTGA